MAESMVQVGRAVNRDCNGMAFEVQDKSVLLQESAQRWFGGSAGFARLEDRGRPSLHEP